MSDKREADKIVRNQLPQLLNPHKKQKIKNSEDMTATADFKQTAQYIGLAICGLIMRTAFGVSGILWGIIREIVNGVFRVAIPGAPDHGAALRPDRRRGTHPEGSRRRPGHQPELHLPP